MSEREKKIEALRKELGCTRAYAASIIDAETATTNRQQATAEAKERIKEGA